MANCYKIVTNWRLSYKWRFCAKLPRFHDNEKQKNQPAKVGFSQENWWSWRELNPRPQAFVGQIYMFSALI